MAAKDPLLSPKKLQEGERIVAFFRRRRLENALTGVFFVAVLSLFAASYLQWRYERRMGLFAAVLVAAVPIGVIVNTQRWMTDRRVLRVIPLFSTTSFPIEGLTPRVVKGLVGDDVRFEDAEGKVVATLRSVDNAAEILAAHVELKNPPPAEETPAPGETAADGAQAGETPTP